MASGWANVRGFLKSGSFVGWLAGPGPGDASEGPRRGVGAARRRSTLSHPLRAHDRAAIVGRLAALTVLVALLALGLTACGGGDEGGGGATAAGTAPAGAATDPGAATTGGGAADRGDGGPRDGGAGSDGGGSDGGPGGDGAGGSGTTPAPGSAPSPDQGFAMRLRLIVADSLNELAPLADPTGIWGRPAAYAEALKSASGRIDATIGRLEALDPPAAAEPGTEQLIDAYRDLGRAVDRGANAFASGDPGRINVGRAYLTKKGAAFRAAVVDAAESLRDAGIVLREG